MLKLTTAENIWINYDEEASGEVPSDNKMVFKLARNKDTGGYSVSKDMQDVEVVLAMNWEYRTYVYIPTRRVFLKKGKSVPIDAIKAYNDCIVLNISNGPSAEEIEENAEYMYI